MGGVGSDIFGEHNVARKSKSDRVNDYLRSKYLGEYLQWHRENHHFHDGFERDLATQKRMRFQTWGMTFVSVSFAATVINPNFTQRRSYYIRKIIPFMAGVIGYQYGYRNENFHMTSMLLKMNEYLPLEVRRTMETKDFRHVQQFDYKNTDR